MKAIYKNSGIAENEAKKRFCFPENLMMENAAAALEQQVLAQNPEFLLILCGSGNNGGDGYALSRRIFGKVKNVLVLAFGEPKTDESILQRKMSRAVGVKIIEIKSDEKWNPKCIFKNFESEGKSLIVDCIYGTGFHGELSENIAQTLIWCNAQNSYRIACDIPSGIDKNGNIETFCKENKIAFCADETVTMGALKIALFSDEAKDFVGALKTADLGISSQIFEKCAVPDAFLIEETDVKLPLRAKKSVHKGNFGHAAVVLGEKGGAGIISGTAALRFGCGLVTLLKTHLCKENFLMSPELMISEKMAEKTTAVLVGSGLGRSAEAQEIVQDVLAFVSNMQNPCAVFDADFFYCTNLNAIIEKLNDLKNAKIVLTPHPKELCELVKSCKIAETVSFLDIVKNRFEYAKRFSEKFENITLIAKGANTYIFSGKESFVCDCGSAALAKAGSGDVLAGLCVSLLAQGYSAEDTAVTSVFEHACAGKKFDFNFECTPFGLIDLL